MHAHTHRQQPCAGERFCALSSGSTTTLGSGPKLSSFWGHLKHHLTELTLEVDPQKGGAQQLETVGMLTSLQTFKFGCSPKPEWAVRPAYPNYKSLSGKKLYLKLPNLVTLKVVILKHCELVVSSPKLAEVRLQYTTAVHRTLEVGMLERLHFLWCQESQFAPKDLHSLKSLTIMNSSEVGRLLLEELDHMRHLQWLGFHDFSADYMPETFPKSLRRLELWCTDWCHGLPDGLKALTLLRSLFFHTYCTSWSVPQPLAELLPLDSLESLSVVPGQSKRTYRSKRCGIGFPEYLEFGSE